MDVKKRRSRRRSALKVYEGIDDGDTATLGKKKRVSFSTEIAEVRNFRAQPSSSDLEIMDSTSQGNKKRRSTSRRISQAASDESIYKPPEDLTVNFDPTDQDTLVFKSQMKTSSTPESASRSKRRSSLSNTSKFKENQQDFVWRSNRGAVYQSLKAAISLGEKKIHLTHLPLSELNSSKEVDMEMTNVMGAQAHDEEASASSELLLMEMTGLVRCSEVNAKRNTGNKKTSRSISSKRTNSNTSEQTGLEAVDMEMTILRGSQGHDEDMDITEYGGRVSRTANSNLMDTTGISRSAKKYNLRRKTRNKKMSQSSSSIVTTTNTLDASKVVPHVASANASVPSFGSQSPMKPRKSDCIQQLHTTYSASMKDCTVELGRRDACHISMLPLPSTCVSLVRPKATSDLHTSGSKASTKGKWKKVAESSTSESENDLEMTAEEFVSSFSEVEFLAPVLTARSTAALREEDSTESVSERQATNVLRVNTSGCDVMGEDTVGMPATTQSSLSLTITENEDQWLEDTEVIPESEPTEKELKMAEENIAQLRKELDEKLSLIELQKEVKEKRQQVKDKQAKCAAAQEMFELMEQKFGAIADANQHRNKKDKEMYKVLANLALMEKLTLWTYEPHPGQVEMTTFKFHIGTQFNIACLSLTLTVESLGSMLFQKFSAVLEDVLTGDLMPSYRYETLKRLLALVCHECEGLLKTSSLPLLLHRVSRLVVKTNSLLEEIELCFLQLGWFEFEPDQICYQVANHCDWVCYYIIRGLDLKTYPSHRLTFSYEPHLGHIPDRMSELCKSLNKVKPSEQYLTKCVSIIRQAIG
ncbi:titin homolog [Watersipora subatra]|uniref:titin homolog n=1 Tax=Watersipora subatra TaxID=2589382 RepID=UPI00355B42E7